MQKKEIVEDNDLANFPSCEEFYLPGNFWQESRYFLDRNAIQYNTIQYNKFINISQ